MANGLKHQMITANPEIDEAIVYRIPKLIKEYIERYEYIHGFTAYLLCPTCDNVVEISYQAFCSSCGQMLKWGTSKRLKKRDDKTRNGLQTIT